MLTAKGEGLWKPGTDNGREGIMPGPVPAQKKRANIQIGRVHGGPNKMNEEQKGKEKPTPRCFVVQFQNGGDKREGNVKAFRE